MRNAASVTKVGKLRFEQIHFGSVHFDDLVEGVRAENRDSAVENLQDWERRRSRQGRTGTRVWVP